MKLYFNKFTRSSRPRWLIEELGIDCEIVPVDLAAGEHKGEAYRKIHPLGKLPALVDGELVMFESAAICLYLADRFPERGLAPPVGSVERGLYYQWFFFAMVELDGLAARHFAEARKPEGERDPAARARIEADFAPRVAVVEAALAGRPWILGDTFSAADVVLSSVLGWSERMRMFSDSPLVSAYIARGMSRPAFEASRK